jgi:hypothetical protein
MISFDIDIENCIITHPHEWWLMKFDPNDGDQFRLDYWIKKMIKWCIHTIWYRIDMIVRRLMVNYVEMK